MIFFALPFVPVMEIALFYALMAVLPAALLPRYVYSQDSVEKEPAGLLIRLLFLGALAGFLSMILESIGGLFISAPQDGVPDTLAHVFSYYFLVVACVEEGTKYLLMGIRTWHDPAFNYRFDGIVYSVFVSLGFAAMENILYVAHYGISVVITRAILSIPGHMAFSVLFGLFYGRAKLASDRGNAVGAGILIAIGYLLAALLHGIYDTCASISSTKSSLVFLAVIVVIYLLCFLVVRKEARSDRAV